MFGIYDNIFLGQVGLRVENYMYFCRTVGRMPESGPPVLTLLRRIIMTHRNILAAMGAAFALWISTPQAVAQINLPSAPGYIDRASAMATDDNARGTIDQTLQSLRLYPSSSEAEKAAYMRAVASLRERDTDAPQLLKDFVKRFPESPRAVRVKMAIGDWYFACRDYPEALKCYAAVDPDALNDADAAVMRYRTAYCHLMMADYAAAETLFNLVSNSVAAGEYGPASIFYLGYIDYRKGDNDAALRRFNAVGNDTDAGDAAEAYKAQIYYSRGESESALSAARKVLKGRLTAYHPEARRIAGESLYNLGRSEEAVPLLWVYAQETPDNPAPSALYILGVDEYQAGRYDDAAVLLNRVAKDPSAMGQSASLFLGQAYLKTGNLNAALLAFERAMNSDFDSSIAETAAYNHAVVGIDGGQVPFGSSVAALEQFLNRYPGSGYAPQVEEYIVNGYMTDRNYEAALKSIDRLKHPSDRIRNARQRVLYALGAREYGEGKYQSALSRFKEAASLSGRPYDSAVARSSRLWQGMSELSLDRNREAAATLRSYVGSAGRGDTDLPVALYNLGYALWKEEKYSDAADPFRKVGADVSVAPRLRSDALARVGDALYHSGNYQGAAHEYAEAVKLNPTSADYALFQEAMMKGLQRDHKGKIAILDEFEERFPTSALRPDALLEKAESQVSMGNNDAAIATYESLTELYPSASAARQGLLRMAVTRANAGQTDRAIADYRRLVEAYPTSSEARMAIDDLKRIYTDRGEVATLADWIATVENAPALDPSELDLMEFTAAEREYMEKDRTDRLQAYLKNHPQGGNYARALYYMAEASALDNDYPQAYTYAELLLSRYPDSESAPDALLIRADAEAAQEKMEAALASFTELEARAANPSQLNRARMGRLRAAGSLGRAEVALEAADRLLASTAAGGTINRNEVLLARGEALDRLGRYDEAYEQWDELIKAAPDDISSARAAVARAASMLTQGRTADAHSAIDAFINSNPPSQYWLARAFIVLSDVLRAEGNEFEADEYLRSVRSNYPGSEADIIEMIDSRLK